MHALSSHHRPSMRFAPRHPDRTRRTPVRMRTIEIMQMTRLRITEYLQSPEDGPRERPLPAAVRSVPVSMRKPQRTEARVKKTAEPVAQKHVFPRLAA